MHNISKIFQKSCVPFKENLLLLEKVSHNFLQMGDFGSHNKKWDCGVFQIFFIKDIFGNGFEFNIG
jgi:hypothetical protein